MKLDYDEISPITKQKSVLVEKEGEKIYKICTQSGYVMNPDNKIGGEGFSQIGFLEETYTKFQEGDQVVNPWARLPTAILRDRVVDKQGDVWLPAYQYGEKWCLHPTVDIADGQNTRWGVSPIFQVIADSRVAPEGILKIVVDSMQSLSFDHPLFSCVTIIPDSESAGVCYYFVDFSKARWYDSYSLAYEAFNKLCNEG